MSILRLRLHRVSQLVARGVVVFGLCGVLNGYAYVPIEDNSGAFDSFEEQKSPDPLTVGEEADVGADAESVVRPLAKDDRSGKINNLELLNKVQGLQQEIRELRGQLELQAHDLQLLQEQQLAFYKDLDARVSLDKSKRAESAIKPVGISSNSTMETPKAVNNSVVESTSIGVKPVNNVAKSNPADEQISYLAAYDLIKNKQFMPARVAMQEFVGRYPEGGYTANAHYWLGELFLLEKNYTDAKAHFSVVLNQFPSSSKCSASLLKIGYVFIAEGKTSDAEQQFKLVMQKYPDTPMAKLASAKLGSLSGV